MGRSAAEVVKSFVFGSLPLKAQHQPERLDGWSTAVQTWVAECTQGGSGAEAYMHAVATARAQLLKLLQVPSSSTAEVAAAQNRYLGLLVEISAAEQQLAQQQADGPAAAAVLKSTWLDAILPLEQFTADGSGGGSSSSGSNQAGSKWFGSSARKKAAAAAAAAAAASAPTTPGAASGYAYEAANMLLSIATWKLAKAGGIIMASGGTDSAAAMDAYQLYCQAAGQVDEIRRKLLPMLGGATTTTTSSSSSSYSTAASGDLQRELLSALHLFALGEAQNVMLQRAVSLNYQGSTLAPMATDTAMLFSQAYEAIEATAKTLRLPWNHLPPLDKTAAAASSSSTSSASLSGPARNSRMAGFERLLSAELPTDCWPPEALPLLQLAAYAQYQVAHCYCLASVCAAETALSSNQAGQAVALAQLGTHLCEQLQDLGFEQAALIDPCNTLGGRDSSRRLAMQVALQHKAVYVLRRCLRENRTIYFQFVPEQPSALPWPQRSAQPEIYRLPDAKGSLTAETAKGLATVAAVSTLSDFKPSSETEAAAAAAAAAAPATQASAAVEEAGEEDAGSDAADADAESTMPAVSSSSSLRAFGRGGAGRQQPAAAEYSSLAALAAETAAAVKAAQEAAARLARLQQQEQQELQATDSLELQQSGDAGAASSSSSSSAYEEDHSPRSAAGSSSSGSFVGEAEADGAAGAVSPDAQVAVGPAFDALSHEQPELLVGSTLRPIAVRKGRKQAGGVDSEDDDDDDVAAAAELSYTLASAHDLGGVMANSRTAYTDDYSFGPSSSGSGSSSAGSSWSEDGGSDGSREEEEAAGLGGFFRGLFAGCICLAPRDMSDSEDDGGDDSDDDYDEHAEESEEEGEEDAEMSKQRQQQLWAAAQQRVA